jgi:CBS domain-containing protein
LINYQIPPWKTAFSASPYLLTKVRPKSILCKTIRINLKLNQEEASTTMIISDVMNTNVVSIASTTSLAEARRVMEAHNIRRLPVIDRAALVGIVTKDDLDKMGPSQLTTFSVDELVYLLNKITVKDVMHRDVVTVSPDATIEGAVAIAQSRKVGSMIVVENLG